MKKLIVTEIFCKSVSANIGISAGKDDVFILHQSDGGAPLRFPPTGVYEMGNNSQQALNTDGSPGLVIYFNYGCYVSLWDHDGPLGQIDAPDLLGNYGFQPDSPSTTYDLAHNNGAHYKLSVTVEDAS